MNEPLDELYFKWLYAKACSVKIENPSRTYWNLLRLFFKKEFVWVVPNDDNRSEDGRDLRYEFLDDQQISDVDPEWPSQGCSVLELLVALSNRLAFEDDGEPRFWFWVLVENLGLDQYNDSVKIPEDRVEEVLDRLIWRTYQYDGSGGLFPLKQPDRDQRQVELWYQLSAYLLERN